MLWHSEYSCLQHPVWVLAGALPPPLLMQLPVNMSGKTMQDGSSAWANFRVNKLTERFSHSNKWALQTQERARKKKHSLSDLCMEKKKKKSRASKFNQYQKTLIWIWKYLYHKQNVFLLWYITVMSNRLPLNDAGPGRQALISFLLWPTKAESIHQELSLLPIMLVVTCFIITETEWRKWGSKECMRRPRGRRLIKKCYQAKYEQDNSNRLETGNKTRMNQRVFM